jgi:hypothetical protein
MQRAARSVIGANFCGLDLLCRVIYARPARGGRRLGVSSELPVLQ